MTKVSAIIERNETATKLKIRVTYTGYSWNRVTNHKTVNAAVKAIKFYCGKDALYEDMAS